jgi:hypothetical protein
MRLEGIALVKEAREKLKNYCRKPLGKIGKKESVGKVTKFRNLIGCVLEEEELRYIFSYFRKRRC